MLGYKSNSTLCLYYVYFPRSLKGKPTITTFRGHTDFITLKTHPTICSRLQLQIVSLFKNDK